jgi:hypothetical protein
MLYYEYKKLYYLFLDIKMKQEDFLVKIKKVLCRYPYIPKVLYDYIENVIKKDAKEHLIPQIKNKKKRKIVLDAINNLFKKGTNVTNLSPLDLIKKLDFHPTDTSESSFDSVIAELRTINFLSNLNLYDITPLQAKKSGKRADIIATGGSDKYVIEVFCKISQSPPQTEHKFKKDFKKNEILNQPYTYEDDLFRYYIDRARRKKIQLENTAKKYKCNKKIMVLVLNDQNIFGHLLPDECTKILSKISTELGWGSNYYFSIIIGLVGLDIIYPPIKL